MIGHLFISISCTECGKRLNVPVFCGNRFCEICSTFRRSRVRERLQFLVKNVTLKPGQHFKMITLTIRNEKKLPQMLKRLQKSFKKLRSRAWWKNHVTGGAHVFEVTGTPGNWHVHIHAVVAAYYMPFAVLLALWQKLSTGRGVFIQNIPPSTITNYLTKYLSKAGVTANLENTVSEALKGYRLFQPWGDWFAISNQFKKKPSKCPDCAACAFQLTASLYEGSYHPYRLFRLPGGGWREEPPPWINLTDDEMETWILLDDDAALEYLTERDRFASTT